MSSSDKDALKFDLSITRGKLKKAQRRLGEISGQMSLFDEAGHRKEVRRLESNIKRLLNKEAVQIEQLENWELLESQGLYQV